LRKRGRVDKSQPELVQKIRDSGGSVAILSSLGHGIADLLIGGDFPCPYCERKFRQNKLMELKEPGGKLTPDEKRFHDMWLGQVGTWVVVRYGNQMLIEENGELVEV